MIGLNTTANTKGLVFGAAAASQVITDASYGALYKQHCGIITTDIALKWGRIRPTSMTPVWTDADALLAWAEANNIKVKGHNLIWNEWNPAWLWADSAVAPNYGALNPLVTNDQAKAYFDQSITETVERYAGRIHYWDVVNEPIEPAHGRADGMRSKTWMTVWGPKYVERAFVRAHAADPSAKLFLNEQSLEAVGHEVNRVKFLALVDRLLDNGIPLHGVGLESHLVAWQMVTHEGIMWLLSELQKRNLEVHISELDVQYYGGSGQGVPTTVTDPVVIDAAVVSLVHPYLKDVLSFSNVTTIITWELCDKYTWTATWDPRSLPFDVNYLPKPFAAEIEAAILTR
jgi:endo-1,4-beta-xylanase